MLLLFVFLSLPVCVCVCVRLYLCTALGLGAVLAEVALLATLAARLVSRRALRRRGARATGVAVLVAQVAVRGVLALTRDVAFLRAVVAHHRLRLWRRLGAVARAVAGLVTVETRGLLGADVARALLRDVAGLAAAEAWRGVRRRRTLAALMANTTAAIAHHFVAVSFFFFLSFCCCKKTAKS